MKTLALPFVVLSCLLPFSAQAQAQEKKQFCREAKAEADFYQCLRKLDASQLAEIAGLEKQLKTRENDRAFSQTMDREARTWKAWRDARCEVTTFESRTGSGYGSIRTYCAVEMNEARLAELKERVDSP